MKNRVVAFSSLWKTVLKSKILKVEQFFYFSLNVHVLCIIIKMKIRPLSINKSLLK